jgi:hypothetical protein
MWLADANVHQHFDDSVFDHPVVDVAPKSPDQRALKRKDRAASALGKLDVKKNGSGNRYVAIIKPNKNDPNSYIYYGKELSYGLPNGKIFGVEIGYAGDFDTLEQTEMG